MNTWPKNRSSLTALMLYTTIVCAGFPCLVLAQVSTQAPNEQVPDSSQIVAEVGSRKITRAELDAQLRGHLKNELDTFEPSAQHYLAKKMLDSMIDRALLLEAAGKKDLIPTDDGVRIFLAKIKQALPEERLLVEQLEKHGLTEKAFAESLKIDLAIKEYLDRYVFRQLSVTEKEIELEYQKDPSSFSSPHEIKVRQILLKLEPDAPESEALAVKEKAETILSEAQKETTDFAALARKYSQAEGKSKGGELEFFTAKQMPEPFSEAAFKLKPGEISNVVRTKHGLHIIKLVEQRGGEVRPLTEVKDLVKNNILRAKRQKLLDTQTKLLREETKIIVYYQ